MYTTISALNTTHVCHHNLAQLHLLNVLVVLLVSLIVKCAKQLLLIDVGIFTRCTIVGVSILSIFLPFQG